MPPRFRKATSARSHRGLLGPRPRVQTRLAPPQVAVATSKGLGPGVSGSLGCGHGLGQAKTSIVEPTFEKGTCPRTQPGRGRTRAHSFRTTPGGRCHIEGTWSWGLVGRLPLARAWPSQAAGSHAGQPFAPLATGCSCSDHTGYDESPSPEHEISRRRTLPEGKSGLDFPPSMACGI